MDTINLSEAGRALGRKGGAVKGPCKSRPGVARAYWDSPEGMAMRERLRAQRKGKPRSKPTNASDKPI